MALIVQIIVALLVAGFLFWAVRLVVGLIPLEPIFKQAIDVLLIILVVAIILFYIVIPLLNQIAHVSINIGGLH